MEDLCSVENEAKRPTGTSRNVFTFEILAMAKHGCRLCMGTGLFSVTDDPKVDTHEEICGCAVKRFLKFHGVDIAYDSNGSFFWLDGRDPKSSLVEAAIQASKTTTIPEATNGSNSSDGAGIEAGLLRAAGQE